MNDFQLIIDALADVVFVHHPVTGKIEFINKTCEEFYGFTAKELISSGLKLVVADEKEFDFNKQLELIDKAAKGEVLTFEWKTKKASGDLFWVEVVLKRAVFNKEVKVVATVRDISQRKEAINAFRERELLLDSINQNITDGIYRSVPKGDFLYVNDAFVKMFGYDSVEEVLKIKPKILYADPEYRNEIVNKLSINEDIVNLIIEFRRKDGSTFWGSMSSNLTVDANGDSVFDGVVKDITDQQEYQQKIEESQRILSSINRNISDGLYRSFSEGGLIYANEAFANMFGYDSVEEILSVKSLDLYAIPKDRKGLTATVIEQGFRSNIETHFKRKDGSTFWGLNSFVLTKDHEGNDVFDGAVRDITKEREAQRKIEESQRILTSINQNISEGLYRSYSKGGLIYANEAFAKMFGYKSVKEILSVKSLDLYAKPKDRKGLTPTVIELGYRSNIGTHFKRKDGSTFWGLNSFVLTKDHEGNDVFDGAVRDITEERESQRKIEESQRILESINKNISDGVYRSYAKGGLIYANDAFAKMFGYKSVEEILKVKSLNLYAKPADRKGLTKKVIEQGSRANVETMFKRKDGTIFLGLNSAVLTKDHEGNDIFDGAIRDITEERNAQNKIEESQRILESVNRNISEGLYRSYSKGGLIYVNDAFAKMFGYKNAEEILKVESLNLYAKPKDRKGVTPAVLKQGYRSNLELKFKRKDGTTFWGLNSFILTIDHEGAQIFDGAVRDITNEKKAAEELNALNDELVERNFELDQLVYKTSHDLRSPLRSVLGLTNLMKVENPKIKQEYFDRIDDRILKMDEFIKSMLNYSRANRLELKNESVIFPDIIAACVADLEYLEGFSDFNIIENYSGNLAKVKVDKLRLGIVFSNLISNAFKYRNIKAKESFLKINVSYNYKLLIIVFEDNGIGIAKKYIDNVFDMFFRATEKSDGSGLGMYIVKQAVDKLHGSVSIESKRGVGTKIVIKIP
jgi:PAS domain S-box-containing protein